MKTLGLVASAALLVTTIGSCTPATPRFAFTHAEQRGRIEANGLRFVVMPDPSTELVEVDVRYEVGSREDPPGKAGLAHLVEHLMFQLRLGGADAAPIMRITNDISTFFNAYTNWDTTHYMTTARAEQFESMLTIEAKRLELGCKTISNDEFLREREVVRNEIRQRGGTAEGQIPQLLMSEVYPKGHAYERMIGGNDAQLTSITLNDACEWISKYYVPERATVIVAGGVDIETATRGISKWFGGLEAKKGAPRKVVDPVVPQTGRKTIELDIERPVVAIAWPLPASNSREGEAAQWGIGQSFGKIAQKAQEYGFAYSVEPAVLGGAEAPIYAVIIELKGMDKLDEALNFVWDAAKQAYRGFDEGDWQQLEEMKNKQKASFIESIEPLSSRTNAMGEMVQFDKDFDFNSSELYFFHALDKIDKFDGEYIGGVIKKYFDPKRARVVVFKNNKEGIKGDKRSPIKFDTKSHESVEVVDVDPAEANRPIKIAAELKSLDAAERFTLGNGMNVVLLPIHSMPIISTRLDFRVGNSASTDVPALAAAAARFLSPPPDAEALYRTGVMPQCGSGADTTTCYASGVSIYLDVMLKSLERIITAGEYSQKGIESWKKRVTEESKTQSTQTELEFRRQALTALYGPNHPYTITGITTPAAIAGIGSDELSAFARKHYSAANATLIITGDFDPVKATAMVRSVFGGWSAGHKDVPVAETPFARTGPAFIGVIGKETPQMSVAISYPAPAGVDGLEGAREVLAEMLNIRMGDIRFKLGATYGTYAGRSQRLGPGSYQMGGTVDAARAGEALKAMRDGIDKLRTEETFAVDFVRARRKVLTSLLGESTVTAELGSRLSFISTYGLAPDFYNKMLQRVAMASPAQVRELLKKELDPAYEVLVTQGDRATLEKAFAEAGITDVKLVEPDYK